MASIWNWSSTTGDNATADSLASWPEGMAPSLVNDSARGIMKRVADLLKDLGGVAAAGGTTNALTLTTYNGFTAYADGLFVTLRASATNSGESTLNVNAVGTKPIVKMTASGETVLEGGEIQDNGIYELVYSGALNGAAGAWLLVNPTMPAIYGRNPGDIIIRGGSVVPSGYLACDGAAVSRTTYAALYAAIGTDWGAGDGSTTFNVPDFEDEFIRGASATRPVGTVEADSIKSHLHAKGTLAVGADGGHTHNLLARQYQASGSGTDTSRVSGPNTAGPAYTATAPVVAVGDHTHPLTGSTASTGDTETRPRNKAALIIIKT